jgi:hypothetical protein
MVPCAFQRRGSVLEEMLDDQSLRREWFCSWSFIKAQKAG